MTYQPTLPPELAQSTDLHSRDERLVARLAHAQPQEFCIWSFEHNAWWKPGAWGYTPHAADAGRFSRQSAVDLVLESNLVTVNETLVPAAAAATYQPPRSSLCPTCGRRLFDDDPCAVC